MPGSQAITIMWLSLVTFPASFLKKSVEREGQRRSQIVGVSPPTCAHFLSPLCLCHASHSCTPLTSMHHYQITQPLSCTSHFLTSSLICIASFTQPPNLCSASYTPLTTTTQLYGTSYTVLAPQLCSTSFTSLCTLLIPCCISHMPFPTHAAPLTHPSDLHTPSPIHMAPLVHYSYPSAWYAGYRLTPSPI